AEPNDDPARVKALLVAQVTQRVRWEASVRKAVHMGVEQGIEVGHGKVIAGLVRRIARELPVKSAASPTDIAVLEG
ncbi:MAG: malonyl CoA-acyl carrier protein transacylase, partial [Deltaproteobacteria bacterium]|nr:malonyl CoA-acyl carrier protein transacylase [Deltaproteobacteria bacterium]